MLPWALTDEPDDELNTQLLGLPHWDADQLLHQNVQATAVPAGEQ